MATKESSRPLAAVLTQIVSEIAYLLQTEIRLAKAETGEKFSRAANGGTLIAFAAVLIVPGLVVLLFDAARWLAVAGVPDEWGFLLVGAAAVGIGLAFAFTGAHHLKSVTLVPERTIDQLRADFSVAKERVT
jgi:hypothetical protein